MVMTAEEIVKRLHTIADHVGMLMTARPREEGDGYPTLVMTYQTDAPDFEIVLTVGVALHLIKD